MARDTRERKRAAIKEAFARHTNGAKIAQTLRIDRPQTAPVFKVNGSLKTSDEDAIWVISDHIATMYAPPNSSTAIPPWSMSHGVSAIKLEEAVGLDTGGPRRGAYRQTNQLSLMHASKD